MESSEAAKEDVRQISECKKLSFLGVRNDDWRDMGGFHKLGGRYGDGMVFFFTTSGRIKPLGSLLSA